ncbi:Fic family protein [Paramagnetospirillum magnetotacticum]|nr:Fic family protein [Paramagnetospirillum magnetotacticum]
MVNPADRASLSDGVEWRVFGARTAIGAGEPWDHIEFALKHEGVDLLTLKRTFQVLGPQRCRDAIATRSAAGIHTRRAWFLCEWLMNHRLDLPDLPSTAGGYIDALDPDDYLVGKTQGAPSTRHRVRNNMPGVPGFCPLTRRRSEAKRAAEASTDTLLLADDAQAYRQRIGAIVASHDPTMVRRAAAFLLLKDSQSSWAIESETAPRDRLERWGRAMVAACHKPISLDVMVRLQEEVLADARFVRQGLRDDGVFVGGRGKNGEPIPDHIGAKAADVSALMTDIVAASEVMLKNGVPPAAVASAIAFGMVYVHPFQDGNGRVHRALIHQALAHSQAVPLDMPVPITSRILANLDRYRQVLECHSSVILPHISWRPTIDGNVDVLNDTADLYRYFDATPHASFLDDCLKEAIECDLPNEIDWLTRYDAAAKRIAAGIDGIPSRLIDTLIGVILNNEGALGRGKRKKLVPEMTDEEVTFLEEVVAEEFDISPREEHPEEDTENMLTSAP